MRAYAERLTREEKEFIIRLLDGNKNRICVSDDPVEIVSMLSFAVDHLCQLAINNLLRIADENK